MPSRIAVVALAAAVLSLGCDASTPTGGVGPFRLDIRADAVRSNYNVLIHNEIRRIVLGLIPMKVPSFDRTTDTDAQIGHSVDPAGEFSRRTALGMIGLGALGVAASSAGRAAPDEQCFTVNGGTIEGQLTSPTTTAGTLRGAGPLNGSTALTIEELAQSAGLSAATVPPTTVSYTGEFERTTTQGTLTLRDVGIFDSDISTDGEFTSRGRVIGGTGRWTEATGVLFFWGDTEGDGTFTAEANGTVCIPKE